MKSMSMSAFSMRRQWIWSLASVAVIWLGLAPEARAGWSSGWCDYTVAGWGHSDKPECWQTYYVGAPIAYRRIPNVCQDASPVDVDIVTPSLSLIASGVKLTPVVFQHGGGAGTSFCDKHGNGTLTNCPAGHAANPYGPYAERLAAMGTIVIFPILNIGPSTTPPVDATTIQRVIGCLADRTSQVMGTGGCGEPGEKDCITDLVDKMTWQPNDMSSVVYVGHSAGGVAGLFMPDRLGTALKSIVMIDAAKGDYPAGTMMPTYLNTTTPFIHIYPDWYGPFAKSEGNNLFQVGTYLQGPWVPIGIREYDFWGSGPCDPDAGCHEAHHCAAMWDMNSWEQTGFNGHLAYCNPATQNCAGMAAPPMTSSCPTGSSECGRQTMCARNSNVNPGHTWTGGVGQMMALRYTVAFAGCHGGRYGAYLQSWVNGKDRELDDTGIGGITNAACTKYGLPDTTCATYGNRTSCLGAGCWWSRGEDGKIIRINDGQTVKEYDHNPGRWYTSAQGYNATGTCVNGASNGMACSTDAACGGGFTCKTTCQGGPNNGQLCKGSEFCSNYPCVPACRGGPFNLQACSSDDTCNDYPSTPGFDPINCTAGDFTERTELLSSSPTDPRAIRCSSGGGTF